ncbi:hypothetical protein CEUSTIGMA_g4237.t1 [Chlamydomonas eustigma]|uniref:UVR domain-containing protein n=1 Tax=Chlamydomonas eustigma TaxID=1157962 RepID=A0A250X133_9CHLO|nr:hypothetical protein CEUSTIGMA_g4237.t1 [Chlamydomonas eustigma]|eukprot:GAX76791.1 hypothetical protein CEUSTIGMA_g4237.t1 [Chlamydomonas eustigma]
MNVLLLRFRQKHSHCSVTQDDTNDTSSLDSESTEDVVQRLTRVQRQLEVAVLEEDYALAARLRDQCKVIQGSLTPVQQYVQQQVWILASAGSVEDKLKAIAGLGSAGEDAVVPSLAALLSDAEVQDAAQAALWSIFMRCKDPIAQEALNEGCRLLGSDRKYEQAMTLFDQVVQRCPSYAEGYNKRATLHYIERRFQESIEECKKALSLQPHHFGAASGLGLCYLQMGDRDQALKAFDAALMINPGLSDIRRLASDLRSQL